MTYLKEPRVVGTGCSFLHKVLPMTSSESLFGSPTARRAAIVKHGKRFLSMYLSSFFPRECFSTQSNSSRALSVAAGILCETLDQTLSEACEGAISEDTAMLLAEDARDYLEAFLHWRNKDEAILLDHMLEALFGLLCVGPALQEDGTTDNNNGGAMALVETNIQKMTDKIKEICSGSEREGFAARMDLNHCTINLIFFVMSDQTDHLREPFKTHLGTSTHQIETILQRFVAQLDKLQPSEAARLSVHQSLIARIVFGFDALANHMSILRGDATSDPAAVAAFAAKMRHVRERLPMVLEDPQDCARARDLLDKCVDRPLVNDL